MRRLLPPALVAVSLLAAAHVCRAQTGKAKPPPAPIAQIELPRGRVRADQGRLEDGTYSNDFFGVSFSIPRGWVVQDVATQQALLAASKEIAEEGATERKKRELEASLRRGFFLLSVSKYALGAPAPAPNAQLVCMAEGPLPVGMTGDDYLAAVLKLAPGTGAQVELTAPSRTEGIGGVPFTAADVRLTTSRFVVTEKYYVTVRRGYALMCTYAYRDEADLKALDEILKSVRFK